MMWWALKQTNEIHCANQNTVNKTGVPTAHAHIMYTVNNTGTQVTCAFYMK